MFPQKNLARKGLIWSEWNTNICFNINLPHWKKATPYAVSNYDISTHNIYLLQPCTGGPTEETRNQGNNIYAIWLENVLNREGSLSG